MKTNKAYTKRLRATRTGKLVSRAKGQNHYNARNTGEEGTRKRQMQDVEVFSSNKKRGQFMPRIAKRIASK